MGRKGGGRKGFLKGVQRPGEAADDDEPEQPVAAAVKSGNVQQTDQQKGSDAEASAVLEKAKRFLGDTAPTVSPAADVSAVDDVDAQEFDEESREPGEETRGQMVQRHKREQKALKAEFKKLGKKKKDEMQSLEEELEKKQQAELAALDAKSRAPPAVKNLADGLYAVTLGEGTGKKLTKVQTKAQKRREKQQQQEAEREQRIEEEREAAGPSEGSLERQRLLEILQPQGLTIRDIPPDGHCMYRSLEDQLLLRSGSGGGAAPDFQQLRRDAAAYMRQHPGDFMPYMDEVEGGDSEEAFARYCDEMEKTAAWGGQLELRALAQVLRRRIKVFSLDMPTVDMGEEFAEEAPEPLQLCYHRHAFQLGEHYNSVVEAPKEEPASENGTASGDSSEDEG